MSDEAIVAEGSMGLPEFCAHTGLSRTHAYTLMDRGELRYLKIGKRRFVPRAEVTRLLREALVGGRSSERVPAVV